MVTGINRNKPYVNFALAAVNVLVFLYLEAIGSTEDGVFMVKHGAVFAPFVILGGEYYRLFTAMFLHFGVIHLANNMLVLLVLGEKMEKALGHIKYLISYLAGGGFRRNLRCGRRSGLCDCHSSWSVGRTNQQAAGLYGSADALSWVYFSRSGQYGSHRGPDFRLHIRYPALQEKICCQNFRYGWIECRLC